MKMLLELKKYNKKFVTLENFCINFNISKNLVYQAVHSNKIPGIAVKYHDGTYQIDENFFIRRKEFKQKVILYIQEYMVLLSMYYSTSSIARSISKYTGDTEANIYGYISDRLYNLDDSSIIVYKLTRYQWGVFRYCKRVNLALNRRHKIRFSVTKELDNLIRETQ